MINFEMDYNKKLSRDTHIKKGMLDNKSNYYIYNNKNMKNKLLFGLAIKSGSILDEKNKKGTAHFTEHMCLWDKNDDCGMDIVSKGYTNYDETIFMFQCNTSYENIKKCINMLKEIINGKIIEKNEIDIEKVRKGLRLELRKENKKFDSKLRKKIIPIVLNDSLHSKYMPIGDIEDIMKLDYNSIINFHNKWYKPEFMSVIAIGDFQEIKIDNLIKNNLNSISNNHIKNKRNNFPVLDYEETKVAVNTFEDLEYPQIHIYIMNKRKNIKTIYDYKRELIEYMSFNMIQRYLQNVFSDKNMHLEDIVCTKDKFSKKYEFNVIILTIKEKLQMSLETLFNKLIEIREDGFSNNKFDLYKKSFIQSLTMNYDSRNPSDIDMVFKECLNDFLYDEPILASDYEYKLSLKLTNEIILEDINNYIKNLLNQKNMSLILNISKNKKHLDLQSLINNFKTFERR